MNDIYRFLEMFQLEGDPRHWILKNRITTNGNCFFHALEYALGNCDLLDDDRIDRLAMSDRWTASIALENLYNDEYTSVRSSGNDASKERELNTVKEKIQFALRFPHPTGKNYEFSNEDVIYVTAGFKSKIIFILEDAPIPDKNDHDQYAFTLIEPPEVPYAKENIVILIRTGTNHYDTLPYPLRIPDLFMEQLTRYKSNPNTSITHLGVKVTSGNLRSLIPNTSGNEAFARELQESLNRESSGRASSLVRPSPVRPSPARPSPVRPSPVRPSPVKPRPTPKKLKSPLRTIKRNVPNTSRNEEIARQLSNTYRNEEIARQSPNTSRNDEIRNAEIKRQLQEMNFIRPRQTKKLTRNTSLNRPPTRKLRPRNKNRQFSPKK
jgi:hypothetical protein